ncbi:hypothetical protein BD410DRAFT_125555 [Rickenella mellea]|uniref:Uncharacterized protein n=1 Tax=Rickenella mellea TaxID=50990 RepID=A0A4Y7Q878_9AGAM|nr:hypothetical protein BD410DRAFT_125555 [Rickenella mellea]
MNNSTPTIHVLSGTVALEKLANATTGHVSMNSELQIRLFKRLAEIHNALGTNENWFSTGIAAEVFHGAKNVPHTLLETAGFDICVRKADFQGVVSRLKKIFHKRGTQTLYLTVYTHDTFGYEIRTVKESALGLYRFPLLDDYMEALAKKCIETPQLANIPDMPLQPVRDVSKNWENEFADFCEMMAGRVNHVLSAIDIHFKFKRTSVDRTRCQATTNK